MADQARDRAHMPTGTASFLNTRTLATAHKRLAEILKPGQAVLDIGCGTGAITRGIAEAVGPAGRVAGMDVNDDLLAQARQAHADLPNLSFEKGDIYALPYKDAFDIVTSSRVLQWLADPRAALHSMIAATKPGGMVLVLDYNHEKVAWQPNPPESMLRFYQAFLRWRSEAGMDNAIAEHLPQMFADLGLTGVCATLQTELSERGKPGFESGAGIWAGIAATRGHQMVRDGAITEAERAAAEADYRAWLRDAAQSQMLYLVAVEGMRPV